MVRIGWDIGSGRTHTRGYESTIRATRRYKQTSMTSGYSKPKDNNVAPYPAGNADKEHLPGEVNQDSWRIHGAPPGPTKKGRRPKKRA